MSNKEGSISCKTCVLKVNIHCEGCKKQVKKILNQIDEVYTISIDPEEMWKVTVKGNVDAETLIKKLAKKGKRAEIWPGESSPSNNDKKNDKKKGKRVTWEGSNPNKNDKNHDEECNHEDVDDVGSVEGSSHG